MGTVRIERCPVCQAMVGEGMLYEHQQREHRQPAGLDVETLARETADRVRALLLFDTPVEGESTESIILAALRKVADR